MNVRSLVAGDEGVLALAEADRLPGQPEARPWMLAEELAGVSTTRAGNQLGRGDAAVDVAVDRAGRVRGVVSYARSTEDVGLLRWLHAEEEELGVIEVLVHQALDRIGPRTVQAFHTAGPFTASLPGLATRNRPTTRRALEAAGFSGDIMWRYFHRPLCGPWPTTPYPLALVEETREPPGWWLRRYGNDGARLGEAHVAHPVGGTSVLRHLDVAPAGRTGASLVRQCVECAAAAGAQDIVVYVDDADTDTDGLARLLAACGFVDADYLTGFIRRP